MALFGFCLPHVWSKASINRLAMLNRYRMHNQYVLNVSSVLSASVAIAAITGWLIDWGQLGSWQ